jgi:dTDP-4-amino-4,6-dideoxygalactose transaminase
VELYHQELQGIDEIQLPEDSQDGRHSWHLYVIRVHCENLTIDRNELIEELLRSGIGVSVHFIPIPLHPFFAPWAGLPQNQCPRALSIYERSVSLPLYASLTADQVKYVAATVRRIVARHRRLQACAAG